MNTNLPPGPLPPESLTGRDLEIHQMRRQGHTLEQIGATHSITRERVRQILLTLPPIVLPTAEQRTRAEAEARRNEIIEAFRKLGRIAHVAKHVGLPSAAVSRVLQEADEALLHQRKELAPRYADDELLECIRAVAADGGTRQPTTSMYDAYAEHRTLDDGRPFPTKQTALQRFGTWVEARRQAGLTPGLHHGPGQKWDAGSCSEAIAVLWNELGQAPTSMQYDAWARGRTDAPSLATVRNRFGTWSTARLAARNSLPATTPQGPDVHGPDPESDVPRLTSPHSLRWAGPGRLPQPARVAVERRAMAVTEGELLRRGYEVIDTSAGHPYDFLAVRDDESLRVEVKGTTGEGASVELTTNEVNNARSFPRVALAIVSGIRLDNAEAAIPQATDGTLRFLDPWLIDEMGALAPTRFDYHLETAPETP